MFSLTAPAKVNLILEVLGRRPDGYHEVKSLIQAIDLSDNIDFEQGQKLQVSYNPPWQPRGDLVLQAALKLQERSGRGQGASICVHKRVPVAGGLGGGSSDAATTLIGLNQLWGLELSREELGAMAAQIGSDVPFFLLGKTALAEGKGERVTPLPPIETHWLVLLCPPVLIPESKTRHLYHQLTTACFTSGEHTQRMVETMETRGVLSSTLFFNAFEAIAPKVFLGLERYQERFLSAGARTVHLAGSGPTLFCWEENAEMAARIHSTLKGGGLEAYVARTL